MFLDGKRVMVTGAGGSIGSQLVREIVAEHNPSMLILVELSEYNLYKIEQEMVKNKIKLPIHYLIGDVRHTYLLNHIFAEYLPQYVFHAAAYKHVPMLEIPHNAIEAVRTNIMGTKNVLDCCILFKAEQMLMVSTDKAVNPSSLMGATKRFAEGYCREAGQYSAGTQVSIVRFGNVANSSGSVIPLFRSQIEAGGPVTVTHRDIERYMMTIPDAVSLVLQASWLTWKTHPKHSMTYMLDMGQPIKIYDLAMQLIAESGKDIPIEIIGLREGEKLFEELNYPNEHPMPTEVARVNLLVPDGPPEEGYVRRANTMGYAVEYRDYDRLMSLLKELVPYQVVNEYFRDDLCNV